MTTAVQVMDARRYRKPCVHKPIRLKSKSHVLPRLAGDRSLDEKIQKTLRGVFPMQFKSIKPLHS